MVLLFGRITNQVALREAISPDTHTSTTPSPTTLIVDRWLRAPDWLFSPPKACVQQHRLRSFFCGLNSVLTRQRSIATRFIVISRPISVFFPAAIILLGMIHAPLLIGRSPNVWRRIGYLWKAKVSKSPIGEKTKEENWRRKMAETMIWRIAEWRVRDDGRWRST